MRAQVEGCGRSLEGLKKYFTRLHVCDLHMHVPAMLVDGSLSRFCQQCSRFQPLADFEGTKR